MRVALVSTGSVIDCFPPSRGGIEVLEFDLLNALKEKGCSVQLFASGGSLEEVIPIGSQPVKSERLHQFLSVLKCYSKRKHLQADIVHCHNPLTAQAFLGKKPLLYTEHNWYNLKGMDFHRTLFTRIFDAAQSRVYRKADAVIALSSEIESILSRKVPSEKLHRIPNYVDAQRFQPAEKNPSEVLFVGRLETEKGLNYLIDALSGIENVSLKVVGNGSKKADWQQMAAQREVKADFLGSVSHGELPKHFSSAGIFVLPSLFEVMPVTVLEAMSSGCAVIASDAFGVREQIENGREGFVFEKRDTAQLREALLKLLENPALQGKMGLNAREKVLKKFDSRVVAGQLLGLYEKILRRS